MQALPDTVAPDLPAAGSPAAPSIWAFLVVDSISFGLFFLVFMVERLAQPELFSESARQLEPALGLVNTLILITGSWFVALAVAAARQADAGKTRRMLVLALVISSGFALIKVIEYGGKLSAGITITSNEFFTFYYALTGFHLLHYLLGMGALVYLAVTSQRCGNDSRYVYWLESGALFWHLVDLLWIFLFAMLYLLGAQV